MLYTLDTRFAIDGAAVAPLARITPGYLPNKGARVTAKASAVLIDARSGFVYGKVEATSWRDENAAFWNSRTTIGDERRITERAAFELLLDRFGVLWQQVLDTRGSS